MDELPDPFDNPLEYRRAVREVGESEGEKQFMFKEGIKEGLAQAEYKAQHEPRAPTAPKQRTTKAPKPANPLAAAKKWRSMAKRAKGR